MKEGSMVYKGMVGRGMVFRGMLYRFLGVFVFCLFSLPVFSGVSAAAGPEWAGGFPKLSQKNALLQWSPVAGASEYKVYRSESKGRNYSLLATVKVNRYIDKDLPGGKTFYYIFAPVVNGVEGAPSADGVVETQKEMARVQLKAPKLAGVVVKDQPGGGVSLALRWEGAEGTDLIGVNVYRSKTKGADYAMVGSSQADTYEDKDVKRGETYYYVVTAVDSQFNETKYSNELGVAIPAPAAAAPRAVEKAAEAAPVKVKPTKMKPAKLLYSIPSRDLKGKVPPELALGEAFDVKVDEAVGHVYVVSNDYRGVLVYNMDGKLQFRIRKDGVEGNERFSSPHKLAIGENGNIYVLDYDSPVISVFDFNGQPVKKITIDVKSIPGAQPGRQIHPNGIAVAKDGRIFISDTGVNCLIALSRDGKYLFSVMAQQKDGTYLFNAAQYMITDKAGDLVCVDAGGSRLQVFSRDGKYKHNIGKRGFAAGELNYPTGLALGNGGEIFSASGVTPNVQAFSSDGKFLYAICNEKCDGPIDVGEIKGIYVDSKNRLYITEGLLKRMSVFQLMEGTVDVVPPQ